MVFLVFLQCSWSIGPVIETMKSVHEPRSWSMKYFRWKKVCSKIKINSLLNPNTSAIFLEPFSIWHTTHKKSFIESPLHLFIARIFNIFDLTRLFTKFWRKSSFIIVDHVAGSSASNEPSVLTSSTETMSKSEISRISGLFSVSGSGPAVSAWSNSRSRFWYSNSSVCSRRLCSLGCCWSLLLPIFR
jgi:hypothetical protein